MGPHNLSNRFRQKRMRKFLALVPSDRNVRILDLGGTAAYWRALPALYDLPNVEITILNLDGEEAVDRNLTVRRGDACATGLPDMSFDVVHSNSVIEHVGDWSKMEAMAKEVRRLAPTYFVQTPNYWFPVEPHYKMPFVQYLPKALRRMVTGDDPERIRLLSAREVRRLFPDAELWRERLGSFTKSVVAIRDGRFQISDGNT
jgi:hypothetical protein